MIFVICVNSIDFRDFQKDSNDFRDSHTNSQDFNYLFIDSKDSLDTKTRNRIKNVAKLLIEEVKAKLQQLENWRDKESTKATIKSFIHDYLYNEETGLPVEAYDDSDVDKLSNVVFLHVYQQYENANNHPYAA